ncbi:MAG: polymer-forming cytoskeletal protein, partial [Rhizobiales bacterium]|nr:polymer-forming cytoskeletal protein [Hyphomicrobiales bacterium]
MFSKKPAEEPRPIADRQQGRTMSGNSTFSVIGSDVSIKGDVTASADLHVDGRIEGDISCASLVQGESSQIHGSIEAETARLAGKIVGSIHARELVILRSARIEGDVHYDALTIEQGAEVDGRLSHRAPGNARSAAASSDSDE